VHESRSLELIVRMSKWIDDEFVTAPFSASSRNSGCPSSSRIARVIAAETGTQIERVREDMERDYWMSATEAIEYGIVWRVVEKHTGLSR